MNDVLAGQMHAIGRSPVLTLGGTMLPLVDRARVYVCGITPYDVTHLGHAAAFVWADALSRVLSGRHRGHRVPQRDRRG